MSMSLEEYERFRERHMACMSLKPENDAHLKARFDQSKRLNCFMALGTLLAMMDHLTVRKHHNGEERVIGLRTPSETCLTDIAGESCSPMTFKRPKSGPKSGRIKVCGTYLCRDDARASTSAHDQTHSAAAPPPRGLDQRVDLQASGPSRDSTTARAAVGAYRTVGVALLRFDARAPSCCWVHCMRTHVVHACYLCNYCTSVLGDCL